MSFAALNGFGAAPSTPDVWTTPMDQLLADPSIQAQIPAARLYAVAVNELVKPAIKDQMSVYGALSTDVLASATRLAAEAVVGDGATVGTLLNAGKEILMAVYNALPASAGSVMDSLKGFSATAGKAAGAVAEALPFIGAFVGFATSTLDWVSAENAAMSAEAQLFCQKSYRKPCDPTCTRAQNYGGMTPADLMHASIGDVFAAMESSTPEEMASACRTADQKKAISQILKAECGLFIPKETRRVLKILRLAIQNSWNDPVSDAGLTLWPAYLDLVHAQFRQNHMTKKWAKRLVSLEVLPAYLAVPPSRVGFKKPFTGIPDHQRSRMHLHKPGIKPGAVARSLMTIPKGIPESGVIGSGWAMGDWIVSMGGCLAYETRAFDEFIDQIAEWELTINPTYQMDKEKAAALRATIEQIVESVAGTSPPRKMTLTKFRPGQRSIAARRLAGRSSAITSSGSMSPLLALAAGGLVGGLGVWLTMRYTRRTAA